MEFVPLRGPVHERVKRIDAQNGEPELDAVVLALAGLQRLWQDDTGRAEIAASLSTARWMIMPPSEAPAAPAQGALAAETFIGVATSTRPHVFEETFFSRGGNESF